MGTLWRRSLRHLGPPAWILIATTLPPVARAGEFDALSLEDLLDVNLTVASRKALTSRESPGIVTLLTREEMLEAGARDLLDALRLVPGFSFGVDVEGVVGLGIRGLWAHEGKVALFIDGHEMNEALYACLMFGNHYPVEMIEKIEIIRGPGSVTYGGTAELAVIQVTTRSGAGLAGWQAGASWSQSGDGWMRRGATVSAGDSRGGLEWSLLASGGQGRRSTGTYTDIHGNQADLREKSELNPALVNLGLSWRGWTLRALADQLRTTQLDQYDEILPRPVGTDFLSEAVSLTRELRLRPGLSMTPFLRWRHQTPWRVRELAPFDMEVARLGEGLTVDWEPGPALSIATGLELYQERATDNLYSSGDGALFDPDHPGAPVEQVDYRDLACFAQALWLTDWANLAAGARWEDHSRFGSAFVPRAALTRVFERAHLKLLASRAYRSPSVMNLSLNPDIKPETATTLEVEAGWQVDGKTLLTANVFDISIADPIIYTYDEATDTELYVNADEMGSRGVEAELRRMDAWGALTLRWALARPHDEPVAIFAVPGSADEVLGVPQQTGSLSLGLALGAWRVTPGLVYVGARKALGSLDGNGDPVVVRLDEALLLNLGLTWRKPLHVAGLELALGLHDLLDEAPAFAQPYDGWHAPLPGPGREATLTLRYGASWR